MYQTGCSFGVDETASPKPFATPSFTVPNIASIEGTSSSLGREREPESSIAIGPSSTSSRAAPHNSSSGEREQVKPGSDNHKTFSGEKEMKQIGRCFEYLCTHAKINLIGSCRLDRRS